jgi:predicted RecB family nuclease
MLVRVRPCHQTGQSRGWLMQSFDRRLVVSPQDLVSELECGHRVELDHAVTHGLLPAPESSPDDSTQFLIDLGLAHELRVAEKLRASNTYRQIGQPARSLAGYEAAARQTVQALDDEVEVIHGGVLLLDDFVGIVDFLIAARDEEGRLLRNDHGLLIHEPMDAKSARSAKRSAILQVSAYAEALIRLGRPRPRRVHLALAGDADWSQPVDDVLPLAESFRERLHTRLSSGPQIPAPRWAFPNEACARCRWNTSCDDGRREDRDLSLVQGFRSNWRGRLAAAGITNIDALAAADPDTPPAGMKEEIFRRLVLQADLQCRAEGEKIPIAEIAKAQDLAILPPPSPGDIWFDIEGDPHAEDGEGLEYLFGAVTDRDADTFKPWVAHDRASERQLFIDFVTWTMERIEQFPDMHIYHYAAYERTALANLAQTHGVMEAEVDTLLRSGRMIDLYTTVRNGLRVSTETLSLKDVEHLYMPDREEDITGAFDSIIKFEAFLALHLEGRNAEAEAALKSIIDYNERDCVSTRKLDTYLRDLAISEGIEPRTTKADEDNKDLAPSRKHDALPADVIAAFDAAMALPPDQRDSEQNAIALMGAALDFHAREKRPAWWAIFERALAPREGLAQFSDVVEIEACTATAWGKTGKQRKLRRTLEITGANVDVGDILDQNKKPHLLYEVAPGSLKSVPNSVRAFHSSLDITALTHTRLTIDERCPDTEIWDTTPIAVLPPAPIDARKIENTLFQMAALCVSGDDPLTLRIPQTAWGDVLARRTPRLNSAGSLPRSGDTVDDIVRGLLDANETYIAVQGPPGTGKTWVAAHVVARLVREHHWRIGIVAQSHAAVENLMDEILTIAPEVPQGKKPSQAATKSYHEDNAIAWAATRTGGLVVGGTAWVFAEGAGDQLDLNLMVVEEAGQFALANTITAVSMAQNALLLGDPQQLPQVSQAAHPEPVNLSVLSHLMQDQHTMDDSHGYFLPTTYRMSSPLTAVVSRLQYEGRLHAHASCDQRSLEGIEAGLHMRWVDHSDNTTSSPQEAARVVELARDLLNREWTDARPDGSVKEPRPLAPADILVVAPYNNHVRLVSRHLHDAGLSGVRVGTVDKFQGQQAPVVIMTMATSSSEDLPRGVDFLLDPNRINVGISRAQWAAFLVVSPTLAAITPSSASGMVLLGKFLGVLRSG